MNVTVETISALERRLLIEVPVETIEEKRKQELEQVRKQAKIDGFRAGKVPEKLIEQRFGAHIQQEVLQKLISSTLQEAVEQEALHLVGMPKIEITQNNPNEPLTYTATFEIFPELTLQTADVEKVEIEKVLAEVGEADVDKTIENMQKQHATWEAVERPAKMDDKVVIDFEGFVDGQAFDGGKGSDMTVMLGENRMIPHFEEGLVGGQVGEEREVNAEFPESYPPNEALAGKAAVFKVKFKEILAPKLPELNEDFFKKVGVQGEDTNALREQVKKTLLQQTKQVLKQVNKQAILDKLLEAYPFDVPKAMIEEEIKALQKKMQERMLQYMGPNAKKLDLPPEHFEKEAEHNILTALLVQKLLELYPVTVNESDIRAMISENIEDEAEEKRFLEWVQTQKGQMEYMQHALMEEKLTQRLFEVMPVQEKLLSFDELVQLS